MVPSLFLLPSRLREGLGVGFFPFLPPSRLREGLGVGYVFLTETPALPANAGLPTPTPPARGRGEGKVSPGMPISRDSGTHPRPNWLCCDWVCSG